MSDNESYEKMVSEFHLGMNEIKQDAIKIGLALPYVLANMAGSFIEDKINDLSIVKNARIILDSDSCNKKSE